MIRYGLMVLVLMSSSWAEASAWPAKTQKVTYPDGKVVFEPIAEKPADKSAATKEGTSKSQVALAAAAGTQEAAPESAPTRADGSPVTLLQSPATSNPKLPCDNCGDGTTPPTGECHRYNPPHIIPGSDADCEGGKDCKNKANPQIGHLSEIPGSLIKFYKNCVTFRANALIPVIVKDQREEYIFGRARYGEKCCEYEVCVVTKCCCIDTRHCRPHSTPVEMRACRRTSDGTIDVYVLKEPGFPEQWVLYLGITTSDFQTHFPGAPVP